MTTSTFTRRLACRLTRLTLATAVATTRIVAEATKGIADGGKAIPEAIKFHALAIKEGVEEGKLQARETIDQTLARQDKIIAGFEDEYARLEAEA